MTRNTFAKELEELHLDLINMGSLVEDSINNSLSALRNEDLELAALVIKADDIVDDYERKIEKKCLNLIARQQPLAGDLRKISTALKMITDMERIADHSSDIAKLTIKMAQENMIKTWIKPLIDIPEMAEQAKKWSKHPWTLMLNRILIWLKASMNTIISSMDCLLKSSRSFP